MSPSPIRLTPRLVRAARALIGWQQQDLSTASGVPKPTISAFELKPETGRLATLNSKALIEAFEHAGLEFIAENGGGRGIRFRDPDPKVAYPVRRPKPEFNNQAEKALTELLARKAAGGAWTEEDERAEAACREVLAPNHLISRKSRE